MYFIQKKFTSPHTNLSIIIVFLCIFYIINQNWAHKEQRCFSAEKKEEYN